MEHKLKILCTGQATYVELDGKTLGSGVNYIKFEHNAADAKSPQCTIGIDLGEFRFMPDGHFDDVAKRLAEAKPPEVALGRLD